MRHARPLGRPVVGFLVALASLGLVGVAHAEYLPGFTLLGHGGDTGTIVDVRVDPEGHAKTVAVLRGVESKGGIKDAEGALPRHRPKGSDRAILFLSADGSVEWDADVAWVAGNGLVELLPDNWGWGTVRPEGYRAPTVEEFKASLTTAEQDRREISRIAALPPGPEQARAASRILAAEHPENAWYVFFGSSLASRLHLPFEKRWEWDDGDPHGYREEVCLALFAAGIRWKGQERTAFRSAASALASGDIRREHLRLLVAMGVEAEDADLFAQCHANASSPAERALAARGLLLANAERGEPVVLSDLVLERDEVARRLLPLIQNYKGEARNRFLDAVDRLTDAVVAVADERKYENLGYVLSLTLGAGGRKSDLARLLALARSSCTCRAQALSDLQAATKSRWEKDDSRWDALVK